jgi:hypothetical protein
MLRRLINLLPVAAALLALAFPAAACVSPQQGGNCCPDAQPVPCGDCPADPGAGVEDDALCVSASAAGSSVAVSDSRPALDVDAPLPASAVELPQPLASLHRDSRLSHPPPRSRQGASPTYLVTRRLRI